MKYDMNCARTRSRRYAIVPLPEALEDLNHAGRTTWVTLCAFTNWEEGLGRGETWVSKRTLAKHSDFSEDFIRRGLRGLERAGLLSRQPREGESTLYTLTPWGPAESHEEVLAPQAGEAFPEAGGFFEAGGGHPRSGEGAFSKQEGGIPEAGRGLSQSRRGASPKQGGAFLTPGHSLYNNMFNNKSEQPGEQPVDQQGDQPVDQQAPAAATGTEALVPGQAQEAPSLARSTGTEALVPGQAQEAPSFARSDVTLRGAMDLWNKTLGPLGFPTVTKGTGARERAFKARLNEDAERRDLAWWEALFGRIAGSDFLRRSAAARARWLTFDWLLKEENLVKVTEGRYDGALVAEASDPPGSMSSVRAFVERVMQDPYFQEGGPLYD